MRAPLCKSFRNVISLFGILLFALHCISCSSKQPSASYVTERVEELKKETAPSEASVRETTGIVSKAQSVSARWEFETAQTQHDYLEWVKRRLLPTFVIESSTDSRIVFGRHLGGDYESLKIEVTPTKESLHSLVTYVIYPD